jgi:hypothetical protein
VARHLPEQQASRTSDSDASLEPAPTPGDKIVEDEYPGGGLSNVLRLEPVPPAGAAADLAGTADMPEEEIDESGNQEPAPGLPGVATPSYNT